jgi:hypothetical protein
VLLRARIYFWFMQARNELIERGNAFLCSLDDSLRNILSIFLYSF